MDKRSPAPVSDFQGSILGPYRIAAPLGEGSAGMVYRARHLELDRDCAVKVMRPSRRASEAGDERFRSEARTLARLGRHPHVVQVFDAGVAAGVRYIAMEYVDGVPLDELLSDGPLDESQVLQIGRKVALGLDHAHRQGVVHRDVKPGNILLNAEGDPCLVDFGLAKDIDAADDVGIIVGTPAFLAPEQADPNYGAVGSLADVYGLGATLVALLTGEPPFGGSTVTAVIVNMLCGRPVDLEARGVRPELIAVLSKAMAREPRRRYQTALAFADDLSRLIAGESPKAQPRSRTYRGLRWLRRHRRFAGLMTVTMALILGTFGWVVNKRNESRLLWQNLSERIASATADETRNLLAPALPTLRALELLARHGGVTSANAEKLAVPLTALFTSQRDFDWLGFGDARGDYVGIKRAPDGGPLLNRSSAVAGSLSDERLNLLTMKRTPVRTVASGHSYDPRKRPFYIGALGSQTAVWQPPYRYFEDGEGYGISASKAFFGPDGTVTGVFHVDFKLATLSGFLERLDVGEGGQAYLLAPSGEVLAGPQRGDSAKQAELTESALAAAGDVGALTAGAPVVMEFEHQAVNYRGAVEAFEVAGGLRWLTLVVVPTATLGLSDGPLILAAAGGLSLILGFLLFILISGWRERRAIRRRAALRASFYAARAEAASAETDTLLTPR